MTRLLVPLLLIATLALSACRAEPGDGGERLDDAATAPSTAPLPAAFNGAWQGLLPCVDCAALEVELRLERDADGVAGFQLIERYLGGAAGGEFTSEGRWHEVTCALGAAQGWCVELDEAAQRWFRHEDGSLQAVDADGRALDPAGTRLLRI